jgi:methionyl-tRNA formyltransferase
MKQTLQPTIFFGSGPVAAECLALLIEWHPIAMVVTKRTPPHHKELAPVEVFAKQNNLAISYADTKSELDALELPNTPYGIVIDYGVIISSNTINKFPLGILNSHFSLLPEWRGADPITFSLLSGQEESGVTLMRIDEGLDTGDIIAGTPLQIEINDTNTTLTKKLIELSDAQLRAILPLYITGEALPLPQSQSENTVATYSRKLTKKDGLLDIQKPATVLEREIRAFNEWPKSKLQLGEKLIVIVCAASVSDISLSQGRIEVTDTKELLVGTRVGSLQIHELMPLGKSKMTTAAFLNGYRSQLSTHVII